MIVLKKVMRRSGICLNILAMLALCYLAACSQGGSAPGRMNCSHGGEVCVSLSTVKSFAISDSVALKITVSSSKDISDLYLTLHTGADITVDGPQTWENDLSSPSIAPGYAYWDFAVKAGQTIIFNRVLHFLQSEGYFNIDVNVVNFGRIIEAEDSFYVLLTQAGGQVIMAGTPLPPHTPNVTSAVYGPGTPVPTFVTNPTNPWMATPVPSVVTNLTSTPIVPLVATSTPLTPPYPPPSSSTPYP